MGHLRGLSFKQVHHVGGAGTYVKDKYIFSAIAGKVNIVLGSPTSADKVIVFLQFKHFHDVREQNRVALGDTYKDLFLMILSLAVFISAQWLKF